MITECRSANLPQRRIADSGRLLRWPAVVAAGGQGLPGKRAAYGSCQPAAVGSVLVDVGVVDRDLQSGRLARGDGRAQDCYAVVPGQAAWARVVDGLHDRLVEDVRVQVDPEPVRWSAMTSQECHSLAGGAFGTGLADVLTVEDQHVGRQRLAAAAFPVGGIAAGEHGHVAVAHERPPSLYVADDVRAAP